METNNLFQICIFFTIGLMVFTLAVNFMSGLGVFGSSTPELGMSTGDNDTAGAFANFTKSTENSGGLSMSDIWGFVFAAEVAGGIAIAILLQDASILGIYIFSAVFWTSFLNAWSVINAAGFIPLAFLGLFTLPIMFIFVGAIIGMLSGV